jgi:hypothetical protein
MFVKNNTAETVFMMLGLLTQLLFFFVEIIQIRNKGREYVKSFWNIVDFS